MSERRWQPGYVHRPWSETLHANWRALERQGYCKTHERDVPGAGWTYCTDGLECGGMTACCVVSPRVFTASDRAAMLEACTGIGELAARVEVGP